ncbi:hypothetical protein [Nocardia testacea]|uniref:hypothetical protein n=1 Tax=Nocardia testacea TaxID=248551 RepID=UPI003A86044A
MSTHPIPHDLEMDVVRLIYAEGGEEARTGVSDYQRTQLYQKWTSDSRIGGRLLPFLGTDDNIRVWIKNGPIKELSRAVFGVGKYKDLVRNPASSVDVLVHKAVGAGWMVNVDSLAIKPLRVLIQREDNEEIDQWFAWGRVNDFKHLVWAALKAQAEGDSRPWALCTVGAFGGRATAEKEEVHKQIADRLGVGLTHVTDG